MTAQCGVWVDECKIIATGQGADSWARTLLRLHGSGRLIELDMSLGGGHYHLGANSRDEAESARALMIENGINPKAVVVRTLASARRIVRRAHLARPCAGCGYCAA